MRLLRALLLGLGLLALSQPALAAPPACDAGSEGTIVYNKDHKVVQYCNAIDWIAMSGSFGGGGGSLPALNSANIWVGDGSNAATAVSVSGDITLSNSGVANIANDAIIGPEISAGSITNTHLAGSIALSKIAITGTPDGSKFLRDDGTWQIVATSDTLAGLSCTNGQVAAWDGSAWACEDMGAGGSTGYSEEVAVTSGMTEIKFENIPTGAKNLMLFTSGLGASSTSPLCVQLGNGTSYDSGASDYWYNLNQGQNTKSYDYLHSCARLSVQVGNKGVLRANIMLSGNTTTKSSFPGIQTAYNDENIIDGVAGHNTAKAHNSIRIFLDGAGTFTGGTVKLFALGGGSGGGSGSDTLAGLSCTSGQVAAWDGDSWECAADSNGSSSVWLDDGPGGPSEIYYNGGYVGLGTNDPQQRLHLNDSSILLTGGVTSLHFQPDLFSGLTNSADELPLHFMATGMVDNTQGYKFSWRNANGSQRVDPIGLHKSGMVTIGHQGPPATMLDVRGSVKIGNGLELCNVAAHEGAIRYVATTDVFEMCRSSATGWEAIGTGSGSADNLGNHIATQVLRSDTHNTDDLGTTAIRWKDGWFAGNITTAGDVTALAYNHTSDRRVKNNIEPIANASALINALQGVRYQWKKTGEPAYGVIAQDVETVVPEAVSTDAEGMKSVEYDQLIAPLIEAVKAQDVRIKALEQEIQNLRSTGGE